MPRHSAWSCCAATAIRSAKTNSGGYSDRFLAPDNRLIAEVAIGPRRLLVWELADRQLAGQFYIEVEGKFLMDDVPSRERAQLRGVLRRYRAQQD
jgi:hypothetical protein